MLTASDWGANSFVDQFKSAGVELIDLGIAGDQMCELYFSHASDLFNVYESIVDEESRRAFLAYLLGNVSARLSDYIYDDLPQYFLNGFMPSSGDIVIDGGAFDGQTAVDFKKFGCEVYSFELDPNNFPKAQSLGEKYGFVVENFGLGLYEHDEFFARSMYESATRVSAAGGDGVAKIISIDKYVAEKDLPRIDFIKMDIEGSELDALKGAALSITRWKPKLAISAYHKPEDVFTLAKFLKSIRPDYEFAFRHYAMVSEDPNSVVFAGELGKFLQSVGHQLRVPCSGEAVLYAR